MKTGSDSLAMKVRNSFHVDCVHCSIYYKIQKLEIGRCFNGNNFRSFSLISEHWVVYYIYAIEDNIKTLK